VTRPREPERVAEGLELRPDMSAKELAETTQRARGPKWYAKYRLRDGRQVQKLLGPAWTERGRPPEGYTRKTAEAELRRILTAVEHGELPGAVKTGVSFADVAAEWLRYIEHDRKRRPSTTQGYRSVLNSRLLPEFGELPVESITADMIDDYRARLVAEGQAVRAKRE
jgi:integrase